MRYTKEQLRGMALHLKWARDNDTWHYRLFMQIVMFNTGVSQSSIEEKIEEFLK